MATQIDVASFSSPLNEIDKPRVNNVIQSACFQHKLNIDNTILQSMLNGLVPKIKQVYKYGRDEYTYGLPDGTVTVFAELDYTKIIPIIEAEVGYPITIVEGVLSEVQVKYFSMAHARANWGYTFPDERMTNPPHPNAYYLRPGNAILLGDNNVRHKFSITMSPEIETNPTVGHPIPGETFFHIMYVPTSDLNAAPNYWFYRQGEGTYPDLEDQEVNFGSPFLPIVPLREYNQPLGPEIDRVVEEDDTVVVSFARDENGDKIVPDTELYRTSKKLLNKADLDMDELCKMIETNPSVEDIDHAYVMFGINLQTKTVVGTSYLFEFFKFMHETSPVKGGLVALRDANYNVEVEYKGSSLTTVTGTLSKDATLTFSGDDIILSKRIDDNSYNRLTVLKPIHYNYIYDDEDGVMITTIPDIAGDEDNLNFIIPLQYSLIADAGSFFKREDLIAESMQIIYNCVVVTQTKWYEDLFKILLVFGAIALSIFSAGTLVAAFFAAAAQGILAVIILAIKVILVSIGANYIGKVLSDILPPEWVMILSIVIAAFTMGAGLMNINLSANMMQAVSGFQMALSRASEANYENLAKDADDWSKEAEELTEELEDLWDGMDTDVVIDYYEILERQMLEFEDESVEDYYNRTIHTGNIGTGLYNIIPNYVEESLKLPEIEKHGYT